VLDDFRRFLLRGNVVDLAVGVVIGAAFGAVVTAVVSDLLTPLIAALFGKADFSALKFSVNGSQFLYGHFINAVIAFLSIAFAVFYFVVKPMNVLMDRFKPEPPLNERKRKCPECLSEIPQPASRCAFCTAEIQPAA
jgi:large conductance mechanosensitive channel